MAISYKIQDLRFDNLNNNYGIVSIDPAGKMPTQAIGRGLRQNGMNVKPETKQERVIRLLKRDFEEYTGISYEEFEAIRRDLIENHPEKLI